MSYPSVPQQVQILEVYVYYPIRTGNQVTALVVWEGLSRVEAGGRVTEYMVTVTDVDGNPLTDEDDEEIIVSTCNITTLLLPVYHGPMHTDKCNRLLHQIASYFTVAARAHDNYNNMYINFVVCWFL